MKKLVALTCLACTLFLSAFVLLEDVKPLAIGKKAPKTDLKLLDISGESFALNDLKKENGLLVIFSCNTCPFVLAWEDRYPELGTICDQMDIGMALLNSNVAKRDGDDHFDKMVQHAKDKGYNTPYLVDKEATIADAFGAKTTPHVFLFDKDMVLVYRGAVDDNYKNANAVGQFYLQDAIKNMLEGKSIRPQETKGLGCSIKRVKK